MWVTRKLKLLNKKSENEYIKNIGFRDFNQKSILVCYLSDCFSNDISKFKNNSNRHECLIIVSALVDLGYSVDIIYCNSTLEVEKKYDVILGFGRSFRQACLNNPEAKKILYLTEAHPLISIENEMKRIDRFNKSYLNKKKVSLERSGQYYQESDFDLANDIICMGEKNKYFLVHKYPDKNIYELCPTGIDIEFQRVESQLNVSNSNNYLWFGSRGIIHKGLDVLFEVFDKKTNMKLFVAGVDSRELKKVFRYIPPNVEVLGVIDPLSDKFIEIAKHCNYMILPSASEGMSTAAITCMKAGLFPILSDSCGSNFDDNAIILPECNINNIEKIIDQLSCRKVSLREKKILSRYANAKFNRYAFRESFLKIFEVISNPKLKDYD
ncbi:glycosyltransferase [Salinivibrio proteolyticus]|uniref:Glycosyltransferase n=1 Tax=Salinivibrio proteolyticus TaxID=334715 RepID=A0ABY7L9M1_9GAMM|nr:glycosyltransferase [Salinivibrio proteolyticus]WBA13956.1 glycosyltransferase [Salinivibrio proteolyticus]